MENKFSEKESLNLIVSMIENAKNNVQNGTGAHFLLWGYLVLCAGLTQFIFFGDKWASLGWLIMIPIGIAGNIIIGYKRKRNARVYTYTDRIVGNVWLAFGIGMFIALAPAFGLIPVPQGGYFYLYSTLLMLTGIALFTSGAAYRFKPFTIGAIVCWLCAIACFYTSYRFDILLYCVAFSLGFIIPGHMIIYKKNKDV